MRSHSPAVTNRDTVIDGETVRASRVARAFAPGGIGNLGPGLDILGCAVTGLGDTVEARLVELAGVHLEQAGHPDLPGQASRNAASIAAAEVIRRSDAASTGIAL